MHHSSNHSDTGKDDSIKNFKVSAITSVSSCLSELLLYPLDFMTTRVKSEQSRRKVSVIIKEIYQKNGFKGFYQGISTVAWETLLPTFVYFFAYDSTNRWMKEKLKDKGKHATMIIPVVSSFVSEVASLFFFLPIDLVQTRMQSKNEYYKYKGTIDGINKIYKNEGLIRLWMASPISIVQILFYTMIQFTSFEYSKKYWENKHKRNFSIEASCWASIMSTSLAVFGTNAIDNLLVKHQNTNFTTEETSIIQLLNKHILVNKHDGFWRGMGFRLATHNLHCLAILPVYEYCRQHYNIDLKL